MLSKNRVFIGSLFLFLFLVQSCHTYKTVETREIKEEKIYSFQLTEGKKLVARCKKIYPDSFLFEINRNLVKVPKNKIESVEQKKVSVVKLLGGAVLTTGAAILILENGTKPVFVVEVTN
nr:hypothetical protein [uncultured Allomuricauda sp.]